MMTENNKPLALPLHYKEEIIYTLAMNVRELVINATEGTIAPEDILSEADCILQALQQVHFSPTSPEPLQKDEKKREVSGSVVFNLAASILKDGWIAQDKSGTWYYYPKEPEMYSDTNSWDTGNNDWFSLSPFNLPKFDDWTESLYQIKNGKITKCQTKKSK